MFTTKLPLLTCRLAGLVVLGAALLSPRAAAAEVRLARHPDYANGKIVFSYLGDLWLVNEDGSDPKRLTVHGARDAFPRFSPDGKSIAFSSSRYGNNDVFVMPASGGESKRLTYHSAGDTVVGWSRDSKKVLFNSSRGQMFPGIPNLYEVPVNGGLEEPVSTDWGTNGSYSPDGSKFAFNRHPMAWSRKHYRGSYAADLWVMDNEKKTFKKVLDADLPDEQKPNNFWPMYGRDGFIYFVSDRDVTAKAGSPEVMKSTNNLWRVAENGEKVQQVTKHKSGSLFFPSMSADGKVIVYEEDFRIYKLDVGSGETREVKIDVVVDDRENNLETQVVNSEADSYALSPSGRRAVISTRGELFTIATERGDVRRLTQTPHAREVQPQWSRDGKLIAFVSDQGGREEVYVCDEDGGNLKKVSDGDTTKGQLQFSPDSKSILYTASDKKLYRHDFEGGKTSVLATGEVSAVSNPQWSPDGKWVAYTRGDKTLLPHVYVIPADGGKEQRVTDESSFSDSNALWAPDGKKLVYVSGTDIGNIGQPGRNTAQLYVVSLVPEESEPGDRSIDSEADAVAAERQQPRPGARPPADAKVEVKIDFNRIARRARQLTRTGDNIGAMAVSPDSRSVLFVTSGTEGGRTVTSIWSQGLDGQRLTRVTQTGLQTEGEGGPPRGFGGFGGGFSSLQFSKDGRSLFYRQGNGIYSVSLGGGSGGDSGAAAPSQAPAPGGPRRGGDTAAPATGGGSGRRVNFTARIELDNRKERAQVFHEAWRVMKHRFYDGKMHGVDWDAMRARYEPLLAHSGEREDMHDVVNMMIGELNASHTGISGGGGRGGRGGPGDAGTRHPGFELESDASGLYKVKHVYKNGPADKDYVKIKEGDFVLAIDGQDVKAGDSYWKLYATSPGGRMEFTVNSKPNKEGAWKTKLTPTSVGQLSNLQYEKWVADRRAIVDRLSNGEIGYLHIRQMNPASLAQFERDLAMLHAKKALVIDQRFNPGGNIDQELLQILQQKQYQYTRSRDSVEVTRPLRAFFGPMVVMANERSTSDAEVFPDGFRTLKLGKIVGVTTYGAVIGTGSYTLMDGSTIRTPGSGLWNVGGTNLENFGVPPDVYVDNTPEDFLKGRDAQVEKAVAVLKEEMQQRKAAEPRKGAGQ